MKSSVPTPQLLRSVTLGASPKLWASRMDTMTSCPALSRHSTSGLAAAALLTKPEYSRVPSGMRSDPTNSMPWRAPASRVYFSTDQPNAKSETNRYQRLWLGLSFM